MDEMSGGDPSEGHAISPPPPDDAAPLEEAPVPPDDPAPPEKAPVSREGTPVPPAEDLPAASPVPSQPAAPPPDAASPVAEVTPECGEDTSASVEQPDGESSDGAPEQTEPPDSSQESPARTPPPEVDSPSEPCETSCPVSQDADDAVSSPPEHTEVSDKSESCSAEVQSVPEAGDQESVAAVSESCAEKDVEDPKSEAAHEEAPLEESLDDVDSVAETLPVADNAAEDSPGEMQVDSPDSEPSLHIDAAPDVPSTEQSASVASPEEPEPVEHAANDDEQPTVPPMESCGDDKSEQIEQPGEEAAPEPMEVDISEASEACSETLTMPPTSGEEPERKEEMSPKPGSHEDRDRKALPGSSMAAELENGFLSSPERPTADVQVEENIAISSSFTKLSKSVKSKKAKKKLSGSKGKLAVKKSRPKSVSGVQAVATPASAEPAAPAEPCTPELPCLDPESTSPLSRTEYAQYLGLQPTVKFKCRICGTNPFSTLARLKEHQNLCSKSTLPPAEPSSAPAPPSAKKEVRITRKVYFCSTCNTYFENWNLYIHMREVHRRHVCLACLSYFPSAEHLAVHMSSNHNSTLETFITANDFLSTQPSGCYLTCCTCESVFSEKDNFFSHVCGPQMVAARKGCAMCGQQFAHMKGCPHLVSASVPCATPSAPALVAQPLTEQPGPSRQRAHVSQPSVTITPPANPPKPKPPTPQASPPKQQPSTTKQPASPTKQQLSPAKQPEQQSEPVKSTEPAATKPTSPNVPVKTPKINSKKKNLNKSISSHSESGDGTPSAEKLKPTKLKTNCLRIKFTPASKLTNRKPLTYKRSQFLADRDEYTSDDDVDLGKELQRLADDASPLTLQNGERSSSPASDFESLKSPVKDQKSAVEESEKVADPEVLEQAPSPDALPTEEEPKEEVKDDSQSSQKEEESIPVVEEATRTSPVKEAEEEEEDGWHIDEGSACEEEEEGEETPLPGTPAPTPTEEPIPPQPEPEEELQLAGEEAPLIELSLDSPPEEHPIQALLKQAVQEACAYTFCVYCTHANRIAVNGKQLAIHLLSEHRFQFVINSEPLPLERFIDLVKEKMPQLETTFFNCDTYDNMNKEPQAVFVKSYECFQCRYVTKVHKDLYLHNRKMHQKNSLVCIMCKSNFYSYSELLCHLCPGLYMVAYQPLFRCCFCPLDNLPSAFRFMVHVRKQHQACDVCLEVTGDQQKLSNHVWKHKLLHFCYRCGIAYRNKPDITKHLFWKHGTESALCKKCLQKKWPYVYHFCIPPSSFTCEECNATFSRAVALKVHKRLHSNELLYPCEDCGDSFISRKLLARHDITIHHPPPPEEREEEPAPVTIAPADNEDANVDVETHDETPVLVEESKPEPPADQGSEKKVAPAKVDVYDLPPLNLSSESEDESDSEEKKQPLVEKEAQPVPSGEDESKPAENEISPTKEQEKPADREVEECSPPHEPPQAVDSVWENFKDYKSSREREAEAEAEAEAGIEAEVECDTPSTTTASEPYTQPSPTHVLETIRCDHDYFSTGPVQRPPEEEASTSADHNYLGTGEKSPSKVEEPHSSRSSPKKKKTPKKKRRESGSSSSDSDSSSSGSGSSSCSCSDSNCSCSSSSSSSSGSSSSDSSDSESSSSEKKAHKKAKKRERSSKHKRSAEKAESPAINGHAEREEEAPVDITSRAPVLFFHESDLDTNESETDEDFYDEHPRDLMPKRNLLMLSSAVDSLLASQQTTPAPTPPPADLESEVPPPPALSNLEQCINNVAKGKGKKRKRSMGSPRREHKLKIGGLLSDRLSVGVSPDSPVAKKIKRSRPSYPITPTYVPPFPATPVAAYSHEAVYSPGGSDFRGGGGSGSEADKRLSKRKRVPKRFYGDSSEEEPFSAGSPMTPSFTPTAFAPNIAPSFLTYQPPAPKPPKKKSRSNSIECVDSAPSTPSRPPTESEVRLQAVLDYVAAGYDGRTADTINYSQARPAAEPLRPLAPKLILSLGNRASRMAQPVASSSSSEVDSDDDAMQVDVSGAHSDDADESESEAEVAAAAAPPPKFPPHRGLPNRHNSVKLYCYCQCPYDEVSEMIACDGKNCAIEWFHFECVGITVPPHGKWYCPDCRKRYNIAEPLPNPEYFYNPSSEYMMSSSGPTHAYTDT